MLQCVTPFMMLWTPPPPARECQRCGRCLGSHDWEPRSDLLDRGVSFATTSPTALTPNGTLGLNYTGLISPIVSAIQALYTTCKVSSKPSPPSRRNSRRTNCASTNQTA